MSRLFHAVFWFLIVAAAVQPTAAAYKADSPARRVVIGLQLEPPGLDPTASVDSAISEILYKNVFQGLTDTAPDGTVKPLLAEGWQIAPDSLHYRFFLHHGVRFHDGTLFDASTVRFSLERARAAGSLNPLKPALAAVQAVRIVDPYTVDIVLNKPDGDLLFTLSLPALSMVTPQTVATNATHPVGTGPYTFADWRRGAAVRLTAFAHYWGPKPAIGEALFKFIADAGGAYAAIRSGDVDLFPDYPAPENIASFRQDPKLAVTVGTTEGQVILGINNKRAPFTDIRVRRAISYALNRHDIINGAYYGYGTPIGSHYAPQDAGYVDLTGRYPYNPAKAKALLAEAGFPHGFTVTLKLPPQAYSRRSGEIVAAELGAIGIKVKIENIEWAGWLSQVYTDHDFDLTVINHIEPMDYDIYGKPGYYFGYDNAGFNRLLASLKNETHPDKRFVLLQAIQRKIADDAVNGFLFELPRLTVHKAGLSGFQTNAMVPSNDLTALHFTSATLGAASAAGHRPLVWSTTLLAALVLILALWAWWRAGVCYVASRIGLMLITLLIASLVIFLALQVLPGDPASYMLGTGATPEALAALRGSMGLDQPFWPRYFHWIVAVAHGDLGQSYTYRVPVATLIGERLSLSLPLTLYAMLLAFIIAVPLGVLAAWRARRSRIISASLIQIGVVLPDFWLGLLLVLIFAVGLHWFPAGGFPGWGNGGAALKALSLPALALAIPQGAILARVISNALKEALQADYIRTARAKGLSAFAALWRHGLPNAMVPALTVMGMQFSFLIAGAIIVENVFALPGLGRLISQGVAQRDLIVVEGASLVLVAATVLVSFVVDIAYALVDPRIARRGRRG
ncbi:MAG: ABC transporter substrate-binding protein [Rhizomicrobium sp.]